MQFDAGVVGPGQAATAQAAGGHAEVPAVLLHHHVRGDLRRAKQRVLRLIDRESLWNAVFVGWVRVVPPRLEFFECEAVGRVTVHLIGRHVHERRLGAHLTRCLKQVQSPHGVGVKVVEGNRRRTVVTRLRRGVDDGRWLDLGHESRHALPVADVELMVHEAAQLALKTLLVPSRVALGTKEHGPLVIVNSVHGVAEFPTEVETHFRADQTGRAGHQEAVHRGTSWVGPRKRASACSNSPSTPRKPS